MRFDIITIFPNIFDSYFSESIIKRAQKKKFIKIKVHNLRNWTADKHKTVDDRPYGGGPGMILKIEPIYKAICSILRNSKFQISNSKQIPKSKIQNFKIVLLTPRGKQLNQRMAQRFSKLNRIILICGRYEGVDERVTKFVDEKVSVGPYVLTGGEIPAMIIVDAVSRLVPGVIREESLEEESFGFQTSDFRLQTSLEYPQYTRPEVFKYKDKSGRIKELKVPKVLLSGDPKKIREWQAQYRKRT